MYFDKVLRRGYNAYIDADADDMGTQMDVGGQRDDQLRREDHFGRAAGLFPT